MCGVPRRFPPMAGRNKIGALHPAGEEPEPALLDLAARSPTAGSRRCLPRSDRHGCRDRAARPGSRAYSRARPGSAAPCRRRGPPFPSMELEGARAGMDFLAVHARIHLPADAIEHRLRRHDLDRHVGEHELDRLEIPDRPAELDALGGEVVGDLGRADRGAEAMGGDLQPRVDEPVLGQLVALPDLAEDPRGRRARPCRRSSRDVRRPSCA